MILHCRRLFLTFAALAIAIFAAAAAIAADGAANDAGAESNASAPSGALAPSNAKASPGAKAPLVREWQLPNFESRIEFSLPGAPSFYYIDDSKVRERIREKDDSGRLRMWNLFEFRTRDSE